MYIVFSVLGLIGGLLCCVGDILFDLKGRGNQKLGTSKNIDSNWLKMADWRFGLSIALAMIGDAFVGLGFYSIGMQIAETHPVLGYLTIGFGYFGSIAGVFIHAFVCLQALIYKGAMKHGDLQIADDILEKLYKQIRGISVFQEKKKKKPIPMSGFHTIRFVMNTIFSKTYR